MCAFGKNDVYPDAGFQLNQSLECWFTQLHKIKSVPFNQLWKQSETFTQIFSITKKNALKRYRMRFSKPTKVFSIKPEEMCLINPCIY